MLLVFDSALKYYIILVIYLDEMFCNTVEMGISLTPLTGNACHSLADAFNKKQHGRCMKYYNKNILLVL